MSHPIYRVVFFEILGPYMIRVGFDDQTEQVIDFQPILAGELYRPLRDLSLFNQVALTQKFTRLFGRTVQILIQLHCMIGRSKAGPGKSALASGK
jgi:hypothetical protein